MAQNIEKIVNFLNRQFDDVQAIYLFGSQASTETRPESDIDIAIYTVNSYSQQQLWDIREKLASLLTTDIDLISMNDASTVFRFQILSTGQRIFEQNTDKVEAIERFWIKDYLDFNDTRQPLMNDIQERGTIYG